MSSWMHVSSDTEGYNEYVSVHTEIYKSSILQWTVSSKAYAYTVSAKNTFHYHTEYNLHYYSVVLVYRVPCD